MGDSKQEFSIGRLSKHTGCKVETIRYYEKADLLPPPPRTAGGHRLYGSDHAKRLGFIRRGRELGFSLDEIRALLRLADGGEYNCGEVKEITIHHLQSVKEKIRDLRKLERTLTAISHECEGGIAPDCPIIEALFSRYP
jgi:MerR family mercuric resistance operon transcriptional regulator